MVEPGLVRGDRMDHWLGRKDAVMSDRFDLKILKTPTQVRNALIYTFINAAKHFKKKKAVGASLRSQFVLLSKI